MSQLVKRILISAILIPVSVASIFYLPHWFFFLLVEAFILMGLNEFFSLAEQKGLLVNRGFGLFFSSAGQGAERARQEGEAPKDPMELHSASRRQAAQ